MTLATAPPTMLDRWNDFIGGPLARAECLRMACWWLPILGTQWAVLSWLGTGLHPTRYAAGAYAFAWVNWWLAVVLWVRWAMMRHDYAYARRLAVAEHARVPISHYKVVGEQEDLEAVHQERAARPLYDHTMGRV